MNISGNNTTANLSAQQSRLQKTEDRIENQNRASADAAEQLELFQDKIEIRNKPSSELPELKTDDLASILQQLSDNFKGNEADMISAQGNLNSDAVLALLED